MLCVLLPSFSPPRNPSFHSVSHPKHIVQKYKIIWCVQLQIDYKFATSTISCPHEECVTECKELLIAFTVYQDTTQCDLTKVC